MNHNTTPPRRGNGPSNVYSASSRRATARGKRQP